MSKFMRWLARQDWILESCILGEAVLCIASLLLCVLYASAGRFGWAAAFLALAWLAAHAARFMRRNG